MNRKRIVSWILIFAMVIGFAPVNIYASDVPQKQEVTAEKDFDFDASSGTMKKYKGNAEEVVVPKEINGVAIKHIGTGAIAGKKNLTKIVLPVGIETIADQAFMANPKLKEINFPDSLKTIGHSIFMMDKALEGELTLGSNLELLDRFTFGTGSRLGSQNVKLNIAPGKTKLTILRGTFGSEQTNVDIPLERPILIKANAFRTEEPVTLNFRTIEVKKGISKEELANTLKEKVLLNLLVAENDVKSISVGLGKVYELPIDWKLDSVDTNSTSEVTIENSFTYNEEDLKSALDVEEINYGTDGLDAVLGKIKVVGKISFKGESEQPEQPTVTEWSQEDFTYGQFKYKGRMEEESYRFGITGFSEKGKAKLAKNPDLVIPKEVTIDGEVKQVEGIKENSFENLKINSVTFPKTDVEFIIKDSAFQNSGITKVTFEEGLKSVESRAFKDNKLTEVSIPSTVWKTGSESFMNNEISKLEISDDVDSIQIDNFSFANNKLQLVKLPYSIFKIRHFVFQNNTGYENSKVVRLETRNPAHLQASTYIIPESDHHKIVLVTDVDRSELFQELQSVKSIVKSDYKQEQIDEFDKVLQEAKRIFKDEKSTQEQVDKAFDDLVKAEAKLRQSAPDRSKLRDSIKRAEALIPEAFEKESYDAMKNELDKAKEVLADLDKTSDEITAANKSLEEALSNLVIKKDYLYTSEDFTYEGNAITGFSESGKAKFKFNKDLVLPDKTPEGKDIEVIGKSAFSLEKDPGVIFGTDTVSSANGMVSVKLPQKLKRIEENAFRLNNFRNVEFPSTLEYIGGSAFNGNRLEKVILPDSVKDVEGGAFSLNHITELRLSPNMTKVANGTFARNIKLKKLVIPEGIKVIEGSAFQGAPLKELTIAKTVEEIKGRAFTGHQLEELTIPGNVKKIGRQAFAHNIKWKRLKKLTLGEGIEEIGDSAFRHSLLLETNLPKSLKKLSNTAFRDAVTTDKKHVVVKLYTKNKKHLEFNNEKSLKNQKVIYNEEPVEDIKDTDTLKEIFEKIPSTRIAGRNRQLTAVELSKTLFEKADTVILTSSDKMVDALASSPYGVGKNAPTLLVDKDSISKEVLSEIKRLNPSKVIIAGGKLSISEKVEDQIKQLGIKQQRIAGHDRFETAVKLGEQVRANSDNKKEIILVNGFNNIDALTAGSLAAKLNIPVLLTENGQLNKTTEKAIKDWGIEKVTIIGGTTQISEAIKVKLQERKITVERLAGRTRVDTALEVAKAVNSDPDKVIFANKTAYPDALIAPYLSKTEQAPIMLIDKDEASVSVKQYLRDNKIKGSIILGGKLSIEEYK